jgi:hypothetical protein
MYKQSDYEATMKRPESGWAKYGSTQNFDKTIRHLLIKVPRILLENGRQNRASDL